MLSRRRGRASGPTVYDWLRGVREHFPDATLLRVGRETGFRSGDLRFPEDFVNLMMVSPHFSLAEATVTATGLPNEPPEHVMENIRVTAVYMEGLRAHLGGRRIRVHSWYRSPDVNAAVKGAETSDHLTGYALDFSVEGYGVRAIYTALILLAEKGWPVDQFILYPSHVHISFDPRARRKHWVEAG